MAEPWAIYKRPGGRYIVKRLDEAISGLWAKLGPWYDREKAQKLADVLTRDEEGKRAKRNRSTVASVEAPVHVEAASEEAREDSTPQNA